MSEKIIQREVHIYRENEPFLFYELRPDGIWNSSLSEETVNRQGLMFEHWHEDLEFSYNWTGNSRHYINGELVIGKPGRLIATNSKFIHNIIPEPSDEGKTDVVVTVIVIKAEFIAENFPQYSDFYFTNSKEVADSAVRHCMEKIHRFVKSQKDDEYAHLYGKSLVLELLYLAVKEGIIAREKLACINVEKNVERMKGILSFIENHYREPITQAQVAEKFYFNCSYFSKYFKQCTGMTYREYLSRYRVEQARVELLATEKSVTEIALDNGFSDDRRFILNFKKYFDMTPLRYRKTKR